METNPIIHNEETSSGRAEPCPFCTKPLLQFGGEPQDPDSKRLMKMLFHGDCSIGNEEDASEVKQPLCEFCRHLRLRHLLDCLEESILPCRIRFCAFEDIEKRQRCPFCHLLIRSGMPYSFFSGMTSSTKYEGGFLLMRIEWRSIHVAFKYRGGRIETARQVYYEPTSAKGPVRGQCKGYPKLLTEQWVKKRKVLKHHRYLDQPEPQTYHTVNRIGGYVNWDNLSRWIQSCSQEHPERGSTDLITMLAHFRVIDVRRRRIISAPPACRYVALSYVWGSNPDMSKMTSRGTLSSLGKDGGLLASNTARTINDAVTICCQLKEDYLWVDQYCIIQDDERDKAEQIASMSQIYSSAVLVIVITDGDMNAGIPGVSCERAQKQLRFQLAGVNFINELPSWSPVTVGGESAWSTRGWTYQEAILAKKKLYFTSAQSFFESEESVLNEDRKRHDYADDAWYSPNALHSQVWQPPLNTYYGHVANYRKRILSNDSDIYNAIDGIASALYGRKNPLWYGLPRHNFDKALLWCSDYSKRESSVPRPKSIPDDLIPSWTWASTRYSLSLLDNSNRGQIEYCGPLVTWNLCQRTGGVNTLESIVPTSAVEFGCYHCGSNSDGGQEMPCDEIMADEKLLYMTGAWAEGCIEGDISFKPSGVTTFASLKQAIVSRWPCLRSFWQEAFQGQRNKTTSAIFPDPSMDLSSSNPVLKPGVITTRVQSAFFRLAPFTNNHLQDYPIVDEANETVGALMGRDPDVQEDVLADVKAGIGLEFIALSLSRLGGIALPKASDDGELKKLTYLDDEGTPLVPIPVVNVMLIRRTGWTARRVSIGYIYLTRWVQAKPQFGPIFLV